MANEESQNDRRIGNNRPFELDAIIQEALCCIETPSGGHGTGLLIGRDLILTCHHVIKDLNADAACRFDFFEDGNGFLSKGFSIPVKPLLVAYSVAPAFGEPVSPLELDYAILQLEREPKKKSDGGVRRWVPLPLNPKEAIKGTKILVWHHPRGFIADRPAKPQRQSRSLGEIIGTQDSSFVHNANTTGGSSGGACFAEDGEWIGVHRAGNDLGVAANVETQEAIPIALIVADICQRFRDENEQYRILGQKAPKSTPQKSALDEEVKNRLSAANILIDREQPERDILDARSRAAQLGGSAFVHVLTGQESDMPHWFRERLVHSTLLTSSVKDLDISQRTFLKQGMSGRRWGHQSVTWPSAEEDNDERLRRLRQRQQTWRDGPVLVVLSCDIQEDFDPDRERALIAKFAELCAAEFQYDVRRFQCVVLFKATDNQVAQRAKLWKPSAAPPYCGICHVFSPLRCSDLDPWLDLLVEAWGLDETEWRNKIDKSFKNPILSLRKPCLPLGEFAESISQELERCIKLALASQSASGG